MKRFYPLLIAAILAGGAGCSDSGDPVSPDDQNNTDGNGTPPEEVSFAETVLPVLTGRCATAGCHDYAGRSGGLVLDAGVAYGNVTGVVSVSYGPALIVSPSEPDSSVLYQKIIGNDAFGSRMPLGRTPLDEETLDAIRDWITEGAKDN